MITVICEVRATFKDGRPDHVVLALLPSIIGFDKREDAEKYAASTAELYQVYRLSVVPRILTEIEEKQGQLSDPGKPTA